MAKSKEELRNICANWDGGEPAFAQIVADYLEITGELGQRDLARASGVSRSAIIRWSNGTGAPHPFLFRVVIERIEKLLS